MSNLIGVDIEEIDRFKLIMKDIEFNKYQGVINSVFTKKEIEYCIKQPNPSKHFAVRFAGKEAFLKAIGTGLTGKIKFSDIEFTKKKTGKPIAKIHGELNKYINKKSKKNIEVSFSHTKKIAIAMIVIKNEI